jgi:hypothetical protein
MQSGCLAEVGWRSEALHKLLNKNRQVLEISGGKCADNGRRLAAGVARGGLALLLHDESNDSRG